MWFGVRQILALKAGVAVLLVVGLSLFSQAKTEMQISFADDQTAIFEQMRSQTEGAAVVDVSYLKYTISYYPSGTKQTKGSKLDRIVERARQTAIREIIAILRSRTKLDFGNDPQRWIDGLSLK